MAKDATFNKGAGKVPAEPDPIHDAIKARVKDKKERAKAANAERDKAALKAATK